jgi:ferritin-like metal-binding protein YciE
VVESRETFHLSEIRRSQAKSKRANCPNRGAVVTEDEDDHSENPTNVRLNANLISASQFTNNQRMACYRAVT